MSDSRHEESGAASAVEPTGALAAGGLLGGATFLLCTLLLGTAPGLAIAAVSLIVALVRRLRGAAVAFGFAGAITAIALRKPTAMSGTTLVAGAAAFGIGLAIFADGRARAKLASAGAETGGATSVNVS